MMIHGSKVLSGVIPLTISTPFRSRDAIFFLELQTESTFFFQHSEWCFFELVIEVETSQNYVKSSLELCWIWIRKLHPLDTLKRWWIPSERSTTHHFQIGITSTSTPLVILEETNKSWQAVYVRTMPFQPLEFCHIPNESWVWKRKPYLWLPKKQQPLLGIYRVVNKSSVGVTVSTFFCRSSGISITGGAPKKKGMEKNTANWDPCRSQLNLLPWQRVMRPYGSRILLWEVSLKGVEA